MKFITYILLVFACLLSIHSCRSSEKVVSREKETRSNVEKTVVDAKKFVNSFEGKSLEEAKELLGDAKFVESDWLDHGISNAKGIELIATYADYEVILFCVDNEVIMVSIQILAD